MTIRVEPPHIGTRKDWASRPLGILFWWGLPIAIGMSADPLHLSLHGAAALWAVAFAWMAVGCLLNAWRCHRVHCYISGPALLLGAVAAGLIASGALTLEPHALNVIIWSTFGLTLLSFLPEIVWRKYR